MMKKIIAILLTVVFSLTIYACKRDYGCDDDTRDAPFSIGDASISILFKDKLTNDYLIKEHFSTYLPTDIKVFDENQKEVRFYTNSIVDQNFTKYYLINIPVTVYPIRYEMGSVYTYKLYINLKGDIDTLDYTFKPEALTCGSRLEYINVKYNDLVVASVKNDWGANFEIKK